MASKTKRTADPSEQSLRVWVIEQRCKHKGCNWRPLDIHREGFPEWQLAYLCKEQSETRTDYEFRYRAATLTFDDDGSRATIY